MEKKDLKLDEINSIVSHEVNPKLDQLKSEKSQFDEYKLDQAEKDQIDKILLAHKYHELRKLVDDPKGKGKALRDLLEKIERQTEKM